MNEISDTDRSGADRPDASPPPEPAQLTLFPAPASPTPASPAPPARAAATEETPRKPSSAEALREKLNELLAPYGPKRIARLTLTRNRTRILSARPARKSEVPKEMLWKVRAPEPLTVRLDVCFAAAPAEGLAEVAAWLAGPRADREAALARIRTHFEAHRFAALTTAPETAAETAAREPRRPRPAPGASLQTEPRGEVYDLGSIRDEVNAAYFGGGLQVAITWGRRPPGPRFRGPLGRLLGRKKKPRRPTIRLGSYCYQRRLVRIHPVLDHPQVPRYVVASVVHHEMVHAALPRPTAPKGGRRRIHTREFRRLEAAFAEYDRARRWLERHLDELLARR